MEGKAILAIKFALSAAYILKNNPEINVDKYDFAEKCLLNLF
jgi:hypothetical protein